MRCIDTETRQRRSKNASQPSRDRIYNPVRLF